MQVMQKQPHQTPSKPTRPAAKPPSTPFWMKISLPVVVTLLIGSFTYYHNQQKEIWEGRLNQVKEQLEARQKDYDLQQQELEKAKQDMNALVEKEKGTDNRSNEAPGGIGQFTLFKSQPINVMPGIQMTLTDLAFKTGPSRYTATVRIISGNLPEMRIQDAEIGYTATYPEKNGYDFQLLKTNSVSATFAVKKNDK
jgi:hypothetical protein